MNEKFEELYAKISERIVDRYAGARTLVLIENIGIGTQDCKDAMMIYSDGFYDGAEKVLKWNAIVGSIAFVTCKIVKKIRA